MSIDRPSLQFAMSVVTSGMSEPKVVHQLQVVRVARYVLRHPGETWLFIYQADPKNVYTDTDWAADELTRKSVSCTVERCGSHMLGCSVAKQSLVALSFGEAEFYGIVRVVATSKQTSQILEQIGMQSEVTIASDSSAARGICTWTGSWRVRPLSSTQIQTGPATQHTMQSEHSHRSTRFDSTLSQWFLSSNNTGPISSALRSTFTMSTSSAKLSLLALLSTILEPFDCLTSWSFCILRHSDVRQYQHTNSESSLLQELLEAPLSDPFTFMSLQHLPQHCSCPT